MIKVLALGSVALGCVACIDVIDTEDSSGATVLAAGTARFNLGVPDVDERYSLEVTLQHAEQAQTNATVRANRITYPQTSRTRAELIADATYTWTLMQEAVHDGKSLSLGSGLGLFELQQLISGVEIYGVDLNTTEELQSTGRFFTADVVGQVSWYNQEDQHTFAVLWSTYSLVHAHLASWQQGLDKKDANAANYHKRVLANVLDHAAVLLRPGGLFRFATVSLRSRAFGLFSTLLTSRGFSKVSCVYLTEAAEGLAAHIPQVMQPADAFWAPVLKILDTQSAGLGNRPDDPVEARRRVIFAIRNLSLSELGQDAGYCTFKLADNAC